MGRFQRSFVGEFDSSFLSSEKDTELILRKLFIDSYPYSNELKKLLIVNEKDCIDIGSDIKYQDKISGYVTTDDLIDKGYVKIVPETEITEHENLQSYIVITYDTFATTSNLHFRDCLICIDVICPFKLWDLGNYRLRPMKIMGYIDGILANNRLTGIGTLEFIGSRKMTINKEYGGYTLIYRAVHGDDDMIEGE